MTEKSSKRKKGSKDQIFFVIKNIMYYWKKTIVL